MFYATWNVFRTFSLYQCFLNVYLCWYIWWIYYLLFYTKFEINFLVIAIKCKSKCSEIAKLCNYVFLCLNLGIVFTEIKDVCLYLQHLSFILSEHKPLMTAKFEPQNETVVLTDSEEGSEEGMIYMHNVVICEGCFKIYPADLHLISDSWHYIRAHTHP
jgi:hypothetical protein